MPNATCTIYDCKLYQYTSYKYEYDCLAAIIPVTILTREAPFDVYVVTRLG